MAKYFFMLSAAFFSIGHLFAQHQKSLIDSSAIEKWPSASHPVVSRNGEYVSYDIVNRPLGSNTLFIQNMRTGWKKEFIGGRDCHFAGDNRKVFLQKGDTLHILTLSALKSDSLIATRSVTYPSQDDCYWLSYEPVNLPGTLIVLNTMNGKMATFQTVQGIVWEGQGRCLLMATQKGRKISLERVDRELRANEIWSTEDSISVSALMRTAKFDATGNQLSFIVSSANPKQTATLWYYRTGISRAIKLAENQSPSIIKGYSFAGFPQFSKNGRWIFFTLQELAIEKSKPKPSTALVDLYSYKDMTLQGLQLATLNANQNYDAVVSTCGGPVVQLSEKLAGESRVFTYPKDVTGDYVVFGEKLQQNFKPWWLAYTTAYTYYIVSLRDGKKTLLHKESKYPISNFSFSPDGNQLVYWDSQPAGYMCYNVISKKNINLTSEIPKVAKTPDYINMFVNSQFSQPVDRVKWIGNGKDMLIFSMYDIWKVDPIGKRGVIDLTNGFGTKHHILLRLVYDDLDYRDNEQPLVTAFDEDDKQNGFFRISLKHSSDPEILTMGPYNYYRNSSQLPTPAQSFSGDQPPVTATDGGAWILSRQTASEYPNYYFTRDWKRFESLTDLEPQKTYNWLHSELIYYRQLDGSLSQGILYKPENFDPRKRYPIIFNYYEHLSYRLNEFPMPEYTAHNINIPWFVSRGYLVFTPDNHYCVGSKKNGNTFGESVCNSVVGAAKFLAKFPYVDSKHMGIQGHSFGGGETNYLVTHSNLFAAACSAGGTVSDQVSAYLGAYRAKDAQPNSYRIAHSENGHEMIGATLWERPDLYFRSSSIFRANKVITPLLLMHNLKDSQTDWGQSFELFTALRRLGKPVWLLQYDNGQHILYDPADIKDFTIRLTQFFDHYLKGAPPPIWMTQGIPAKLKGIEQGYELDTSGRKP